MLSSRKRNKKGRRRGVGLEQIEPRVLFSISIGGITIPSIPGLPSIPSLGTSLGSILGDTNVSDILSYIPELTKPTVADEWWVNNTGQTLPINPEGPATGTPGADINALNAWNITQGSSNVVVAVLDTGIDLNNPDLASVLWTNPKSLNGNVTFSDGTGIVDDVHGWNFVDGTNDVTDNFVHGTAVADAIHSVAPGVTILPVEVGTASGVDPQDVIDGINYIIALKKEGVNIVAINASYIDFSAPTSGEITAVKNAGTAGMLYVAAAGNSGIDLDSFIPSIPGIPSSIISSYVNSYIPSNLIFVAATDNQDNLASFSDYGSELVSVGAPGVDMDLAIPGDLYAPLSGTSFAAPMVTGIAALLKSEVPGATVAQLKAAILNSGETDPSLVGKTITGKRVDAYAALEYLMGQQMPTGAVTTINNSVIEGWAFDPNLGMGAASVEVSVDGVLQAPILADTTDAALAAKLGSTDHAFSIDVASLDLAYGKHTIKVYAVDNSTSKMTQIGSGTVTQDTAPIGALESTTNNVITGWAIDTDTPDKSIQVKFYIDGKAWQSTTANVNRPDLSDDFTSATTTHGFSYNAKIPAGIHTLDVYAVDSLTGALTLIGETVVSSNRPVTGVLESVSATTIAGWAYDPDSGSGSVQVRYTIDGGAPVFVTANVSRPDLLAQLGSKGHGFVINLPQLTAGDHTIEVDAVDPQSKALVELGSQVVTVTDSDVNPLASGTVDTLTSSLVAGTVTDTNSTSPIKVRVDIDGKVGKTFLSTVNGDDPTSTTYNYSYTMPKLSAGPHRVDVYAIDALSGVAVLLSRELVGYTAPSGTVPSINAVSAIGFALNPNVSNKQAQVRIDVDGLMGSLVTASVKRTDLTVSEGATNIGFSVKMPTLPPGTHHVTVTVIDPTTLEPVVIFDGDVVYS